MVAMKELQTSVPFLRQPFWNCWTTETHMDCVVKLKQALHILYTLYICMFQTQDMMKYIKSNLMYCGIAYTFSP